MPDIEMKMNAREFLPDLALYLKYPLRVVNDAYEECLAFPERWGGGTVEPAVAQLLYIITVIEKPEEILEIGTNYGYSTFFLGAAQKFSPSGHVTTWEIDRDYAVDAQQKIYSISEIVGDRISFKLGSSQDDAFRNWLQMFGSEIGLVFIDASHEYDQTMKELELIYNCCKPGTIVAMHDIFSDGVSQALKDFGQDFLSIPTQPNTGFGVFRL